MEYKCKEVILKNPLWFWEHFKGKERILFYNSNSKEYIIGAISVKPELQSNHCNYPYVFYPMTFFDRTKDIKWGETLKEGIVFEYYLVVRETGSTLYYYDKPVEVMEQKISSNKVSYQIEDNDYERWSKVFWHMKHNMQKNEISKVVISREVEIKGESEFNDTAILSDLIKNNEQSFVFAYYKEGRTFLGATPEILVEKKGIHIMSHALAGTIVKQKENAGEQGKKLLEDKKNNYEHQIVADIIAETMRGVTKKVQIGKTGLMELKNLFHLRTIITAEDSTLDLLSWVKLLHPTPAIGGSPKEMAMDLIEKYEPHDRGRYAAPLGVVDRNGDGIFVVAIRSGLVMGSKLFAYAGCGIVEQSDCREEYEETNNKLRTILECL
jgi:menaquinone-specific isochorismate synthase